MGGRYTDSYLREMAEYARLLATGPDVAHKSVPIFSGFLSDVLQELLELRKVANRPNGIAVEPGPESGAGLAQREDLPPGPLRR